MRYTAVIMTPRIVQFEASGEKQHVTNEAWALCNNFDSVILPPDTDFKPKLLAVIRDSPEVAPPLVFDPPPHAA